MKMGQKKGRERRFLTQMKSPKEPCFQQSHKQISVLDLALTTCKEEDLKTFIDKLPQLHSFILEKFNLSDDMVLQIAQAGHKLKTLSFKRQNADNKTLSDSSFIELLKGCPELQSLTM